VLSTSFLAETDLLILGAGVAGIYAALWAEAEGARTLVVSKDPLPSGSTPWAQGGIAFPLDAADVEAHLQDTLQAGRGLVEAEVARSILQEAPFHLEKLLSWGLPFHPEPVREGGHSRARIRHLGGDRSGLWLLKGLLARLSKPPLQGYTALSLLMTEGRVAGVLLLGPEGLVQVRAGAVLLATGGFGSLFPLSTAPPGASGDGMALAWRAGAILRDLEFVQFHPTVLPNGALVSEAARGAGAVLLNAWGERFMPRYAELEELAPRDVVAQAVFWERQRTGGVYLDLRAVPHLEERFPTVVASARALRLDPKREPLPVAPAAHYVMGGGCERMLLAALACRASMLPGRWPPQGCTGQTVWLPTAFWKGWSWASELLWLPCGTSRSPPPSGAGSTCADSAALSTSPAQAASRRSPGGGAGGRAAAGFSGFCGSPAPGGEAVGQSGRGRGREFAVAGSLGSPGGFAAGGKPGMPFPQGFPQEREPFHTEVWGSTFKQAPLDLAAAPGRGPA
jgi:L-aspartate oxidase